MYSALDSENDVRVWRTGELMYVVHLGRLKAPRKAAGQMDLLTVPSADGVDSKVIQVEEALSASSRDR